MVRHAFSVAVLIVLNAGLLQAQDALFTVTNASANVHLSPSIGSAVLGSAPRGRAFEVRRELGSWVAVPWPDAPDGIGYVHVTWGRISRASDVSQMAEPRTGSALDPVSEAAASIVVAQANETQLESSRSGRDLELPSHLVGLGGRFGTEAFGFAVTGRVWSGGPLGVQFDAERSTMSNSTALRFASSLIYSLPSVVTNAVWLRPYLGTGAHIYRSTFSNVTPGAPEAVDSGVGYQAFGGAELTWANLPQFSVSADVRQQWAPAPFDGVGFSMSAHWYVK